LVKVKKPYHTSIDYNIVVPVRTGIKCDAFAGNVEMRNIKGDIVAHVALGDVFMDNIAGRIQLNIESGSVKCRQITSSDFTAESSCGDMMVLFADDCPPDLSVKLTTSLSDVEVDLPPNFAGAVFAQTSLVKIKTELPIIIRGKSGWSRLTGTIGKGSGRLDIKTSIGSVKIE